MHRAQLKGTDFLTDTFKQLPEQRWRGCSLILVGTPCLPEWHCLLLPRAGLEEVLTIKRNEMKSSKLMVNQQGYKVGP